MGLIDILAKALSRRPTETDSGYVGATVRVTDEVASITRNTINDRDYVKVGRAISGSIYNAAMIMAMECASYPIKLYRPAGTSKTGKARPVSRKAAKFLRGKGLVRPSAKAVSKAGEEEIEEVYEHPVLDLIADPDPVTTSSDFFTLLYFYRETTGKCFIWTGERVAGKPSGLYILHPHYTVPILSTASYITGYKYGRETTAPVTYPVEEVIYSRYAPDPFRPWDGMSWLSSIELYGDVENAALTAEIARWRNGGQPGFVLKVPTNWSDAQVKQAEAALRAKGGPLKAGQALVVKDADVIQSASKPHEMGYIAGLEQAEKAIYRAAGIPEAIWKMNDANLASAKTASPQFLRSAYARMKRVAEDLTEYLLPMFGESDMWFGYENPVTEDAESDSLLMDRGWNSGYVYTNEARAALDLDPVDDDLNTLGKVAPAMTFTMPPTEKPSAAKTEDPEEPEDPEDPTGGVAADGGAGSGESAGGDAAKSKRRGDDTCAACGAHTEPQGKAGAVELIDVPRWGAFIACGCQHKAAPTNDPIEQQIMRAVQAWAEDALTRGINAIRPDGTFDIAAVSTDELSKLMSNAITAAFEAGAVGFTTAHGVDTPPLTSQAARDYIASYQFDLVSGVTQTMADQMRTTIDAGLEQGKTINEIQQELTDKVPEVSLARAETIARTETARAYQHGSLKQAEELGFDSKRWSLSGNPCGLCEGAAAASGAKKVPIGEPFFAAGETIAGTDGRTYTMTRPVYAASDLHPNCSCSTIEYIDEGGDK